MKEPDFAPESVKTRRKWHHTFLVRNDKSYQYKVQYIAKISFTDKGEIKVSSEEKEQKNCHQQTYYKRSAKGNFLNRKKMTKKKILENENERTQKKSKVWEVWVNIVIFLLSFK